MNPDTILNTVVLPAPFGPISAVIDPSSILNDAASTAVTPPNDLLIASSSSSMASFLEQQLATVPKKSLWAHCHEQHEKKADKEQPQERARSGVDQREREEVEKPRTGVKQAKQHSAEWN